MIARRAIRVCRQSFHHSWSGPISDYTTDHSCHFSLLRGIHLLLVAVGAVAEILIAKKPECQPIRIGDDTSLSYTRYMDYKRQV